MKITDKTGRKISEGLSKLIQGKLNSAFDLSQPQFPLGICNSCRLSVSGKGTGKLPTMPNYHDITLLKPTRHSEDQLCQCYICITARKEGGSNAQKKAKRSLSPDLKYGLHAKQNDSGQLESEDSAKKTKISVS